VPAGHEEDPPWLPDELPVLKVEKTFSVFSLPHSSQGGDSVSPTRWMTSVTCSHFVHLYS
jgi:hypothetical protein